VRGQIIDHVLHPIGAEAAYPAAYPRLRHLVPAGDSRAKSIRVIESHQFRNIVAARASDQRFDRR
jgi:hypothetical protein